VPSHPNCAHMAGSKMIWVWLLEGRTRSGWKTPSAARNDGLTGSIHNILFFARPPARRREGQGSTIAGKWQHPCETCPAWRFDDESKIAMGR
jgi:hypothetical protein